MTGLLNTPLELPCPLCGRPLRATLREVHEGRTTRCPGGHDIELRAEGGDLGRAARQFDRAMSDVQRSLRRLGQRR